MIITIDTTKDSEEDILKAITFLNSIINKTLRMQDTPIGDAIANIFDAAPASASAPAEQKELSGTLNGADSSIFIGASEKREEPLHQIPKVIAYGW